MKDDESKSKDEAKSAVEGEGSYSATRKYNQHVSESVASGELEAAAEEARRAVDGPEGAELKQAEELAKKGPESQAASAAPRETAD